MALVQTASNEKKRVKVYELKNNDWFDRGTGFCTGRVIGVSFTKEACRSAMTPKTIVGWLKDRGLVADRFIQDESKIYVESEDQPERLLLDTKIVKDDGYQKQQGEYSVYNRQK